MSREVQRLHPQATGEQVVLVDADPTWPLIFEDEANHIRAILGELICGIHHAGSTAVPGLAAKPVIDIVLEVEDPTKENQYVSPLEAIGYLLHVREPDWYEHRLLRRSEPTVNLHIFPKGSLEVNRMIAFRDWLRSHPDDRTRYEHIKRELASRKWTYVQDYADAKSAIVEEILGRAMIQK